MAYLSLFFPFHISFYSFFIFPFFCFFFVFQFSYLFLFSLIFHFVSFTFSSLCFSLPSIPCLFLFHYSFHFSVCIFSLFFSIVFPFFVFFPLIVHFTSFTFSSPCFSLSFIPCFVLLHYSFHSSLLCLRPFYSLFFHSLTFTFTFS